MGQQQTRGNNSQHQLNHSKFRHVSFPGKPCDKDAQTMQVEFPCDQLNYKNWKQQLQSKQKALASKKYLLVPLSHKYSNAGLCSKMGLAKVTYGKFPFILEDQIKSVRQKNSTFSQPEIWKLLYSIVSAKNQYWDVSKNSSNNLGNINPNNIFLNEKSDIKLANPLSWPNYLSGYKNAVLKETSYLSPEDMKLLQLGAIKNDENQQSEIYAIGMTLLSVGMTENFQHLYDLEKNTFNSKTFDQRKIIWKTTLYYSQILRGLVLNLLSRDPSKRLNIKEISEFLKPHVANIEFQKPLTINNAPQKVHSQVDRLRDQLKGLISYRFDKYSPPKQSKTNKNPSILQKVQNPQQSSVSILNRAKSQTRFTYSNRPLDIVSPNKIVLTQQTSVKSPQQLQNNSPVNVKSQRTGVQGLAKTLSKQQIQERGTPIVSKQFTPVKVSTKSTQNIVSLQSGYNSYPQQENYMKQTVQVQSPRNRSPPKPVNIIDQIYPPRSQQGDKGVKKATQIAQRLIQQGQGKIIRTDSQIQVSQTNRQSSSTQINQLTKIMSPQQMKASFQTNNNFDYHTYAEILIKADFDKAWTAFQGLIKHPDQYFAQLEDKIAVNNKETIDIPPGRVRLQSNKQEGKVHLQNVSSSCKGDILGGVSKNANGYVQAWFNSSYTHEGKPFPPHGYFMKSLNKLKAILQSEV